MAKYTAHRKCRGVDRKMNWRPESWMGPKWWNLSYRHIARELRMHSWRRF